jgi:hypothetical protein
VMPRHGLYRTRRAARRPATCRLAVEALEGRSVPAVVTTVMSGLDNPRGLAFGPEGGLYVAEAGRGGDGPSIVLRPGVVASYGPSGAVSRLWHGRQERVATGLPSLSSADGTNGPHDISFQGRGGAYVTVGFGTNPTRRAELGDAGNGFAQLVRLLPNGHWENVTDLGDYEAAVNPGGGPIDSNPFGLLAEPGGRVVVDAGGNSLLRIAANGEVSTLAQFPSRDDGRPTDAVPTSVIRGPDGAYYVGELTGVPFAAGAANIYRVIPGEAPQIVHTGFKTIIDLDFGPDGSLYVLQHATGPFLSGNGSLIRVAPDGTRTTIQVEGLTLTRPTSVLVADDGAIYVTNRGISVGTGEVIRITFGPAQVDSVVVNDGAAQRSMVSPPLNVLLDRAMALDTGAFQLLASEVGSSLTTPEPRPRFETADPDRCFDDPAADDQAGAAADSMLPHENQPEIAFLDLVFVDAWVGGNDLFARPTR